LTVVCIGGGEASRGTVLAELDTDNQSDDDDNDDDDNNDDNADNDKDDSQVLLERALRRRRQPKLHGTVRVIWNHSEDGDVSRHRVGHEGHVDVWCIATAPGGAYYKEHLAMLDRELVADSGWSLAAEDGGDDDDDDDVVEQEEEAGETRSSIKTPLGNSTYT